jgi:acetyl-CoA/propionyl-CoA carboxylase biotin carboxyl carrier protein
VDPLRTDESAFRAPALDDARRRIITGSEQRILIANRGEIAVRVIRTCREMGIPTVAVYSEADRDALHVEMADEAYLIGVASPAESYLNVGKILEVAARAGATMIHPGYGVLAENDRFARAVADAGMTFIGPPPEAMAMMGDKSAARDAAREAGAPIVPGTDGPVDAAAAQAQAAAIGFPLVVKASFGGGGKGMRTVEAESELADAVEGAAREAGAYFGRPEVYLERYIGRAHHVEAQILADTHSNVSFLGERDCTLQRRHQKLVEESPSPLVDEGLRTRIGDAAVGIARRAGYVGAGTVEFLLEEDGSFYFMEMNARLQVEHPVTEMVTGLDLVRLQIEVAMGETVAVEPDLRGHAIECRLNAEDPFRDFLPGPGLVTRLQAPGGPFVRFDTGIGEGRAVVGNYDSMFAKLIVWDGGRDGARRRMLRALDELVVEGIPTTAAFHRWVLQTPEFAEATATTGWVEEALDEGRLQRESPGAPASAPETAGAAAPVRLVVEVDGHRIPVSLWGEGMRTAPRPPESTQGGHGAGDGEVVVAPMQGTILDVLVESGQEIAAGEDVCILEAMKMENRIAAHRAGTVAEILVKVGDVVQTGQPLFSIE